MRLRLAVLTVLVLASAGTQAQDPARLFKAAIDLEEIDRNLPAAIEQYQKVVASGHRALAAQALLRTAGCYERLGKDTEAQRVYAQLTREFADQTAVVAKARARAAAKPTQGPTELSFPSRSLVAMQIFPREENVSPDGRFILWHRQIQDGAARRFIFMLRDIRAGNDLRLFDSEANFFQRGVTNAGPIWSPDGRYIALQLRNSGDSRTDLQVITLATKAVRTLKTVTWAGTTPWRWTFNWSADSQWLVAGARPDTSMSAGPARGRGAAPSAAPADAPAEPSEIVAIPMTSGEPHVVGSTDRPIALYWSPDRRTVAFLESRRGERVHQIRIAAVPGSTHRAVAADTTLGGIMWSPKGTELAVLERDPASGAERIRIIDVTASTSRTLSLPSSLAGAALESWTGKGDLYFSVTAPRGPGRAYFLLPPAGGEPRKICDARDTGDRCWGLTPGGAWQIVTTGSPAKLILRATADGKDTPLTRGAGEEGNPRTSSDGRLISFSSNRDGRWGLYVAPLDRAPVADPILVQRFDNSPACNVEASTGFFNARGQLAQACNSGETHLYRVDMSAASGKVVDGLRPVRLTVDGWWNDYPSISPDSKHIAFWQFDRDKRRLMVTDAEGGQPRAVVERPFRTLTLAESVRAPELSDRGVAWRSSEEVVFYDSQPAGGAKPALVAVSIRNGATTRIPFAITGGPARVMSSTWTIVPARDEVLYLVDKRPFALQRTEPLSSTLRARSLTSATDRVVIDDVVEFVVSADASHIAYRRDLQGGGTELRLATVDGADAKLLQAFPPRQGCCPPSPASLSPSAAYFAYSGPGGRHRIQNVGTLDHQLLLPDDPSAPEVEWDFPAAHWSPDGTFILLVGDTSHTDRRVFEGITYDAVIRAMKR